MMAMMRMMVMRMCGEVHSPVDGSGWPVITLAEIFMGVESGHIQSCSRSHGWKCLI